MFQFSAILLILAVVVSGNAVSVPVSHFSVKKLHDAIESACAGNGSGSLREIESFNAPEALAEIKTTDKGCEGDREYSSSREDAVKRFKISTKKVDMIRECLQEYVTKHNLDLLNRLVTQPENLGVFASEMSGHAQNPEACMYYDYVIYYQDKWSKKIYRVHFTFNYTD